MGNEQIEILRRQAVALEDSSRDFLSFADGKLEDRRSILFHVMQPLINGFVRGRTAAAAGWHAQRAAARAIDLVFKIEYRALRFVRARRHDDRSRTVAKQDACRAILVV